VLSLYRAPNTSYTTKANVLLFVYKILNWSTWRYLSIKLSKFIKPDVFVVTCKRLVFLQLPILLLKPLLELLKLSDRMKTGTYNVTYGRILTAIVYKSSYYFVCGVYLILFDLRYFIIITWIVSIFYNIC
jgi:hypothetical protein